jgi:aminopeptidase N
LILSSFLSDSTVRSQPADWSFDDQGRFAVTDRSPSHGRFRDGESSYDGPQPFDILSYRLDLFLPLTSDALYGRSGITMVLKASVDSIILHAVGLQLDTVRVNGALKGIRPDSVAETFTVYLNSTHHPGDTLRVSITYRRIQGYPRPTSRHGYYHFSDSIGIPSDLGYTLSAPSDARFWMPCFDEPWEKATAELNLTVPSGYTAASNGRIVGVVNNGDGTVTWQWKEDHQIATYLMCLTVSRFTVSSLPHVTTGSDTILLQYYAWTADSAECAEYLPTVRQMVAAYEGLFGEYPFDKYGMAAIVPFLYLGMEHQTMTTLNRLAKTRESVVAHELAHQWWGDLVTCGTWRDVWLNEGFASYSEALWREHLGGPPALKSYMKDSLEHFHFASWLGAVYDPVGQGFNLFDDVVYGKAAWVLHTLRGVVGDSVFFRILGAYRQRFGGKSAITSELEAVVDSVTGTDMSWFFSQWIYGPGWPVYALSAGSPMPDSTYVTVYQLQPGSWPTYRMPINLRIGYAGGGDTTCTVWDSLRVQTFAIPISGVVDSVALDPDLWILKQVLPPPVGVRGWERPASSDLLQNFPNPFNSATVIWYELRAVSEVRLVVYDLLGREVATLVNEARAPGTYAATFDAGSLSSGIYFYRLTADGYMKTRTMVLMK